MRNSTDQLNRCRSTRLKEVSISDEGRYQPVKQENFVAWEREHNYKTSYSSMNSLEPQLVNVHFIPNYKGFVPRIKSENMFGKNYTSLANTGIRKFDEIRFSGENSDNFKEYHLYLLLF